MNCLILAAGYATRLYPLTENFPKPLLKVGSRTILDTLMDDLDASGEIDGYTVVTNHKFAELFRRWAEDRSTATKREIEVVDDGTESNETRLGAVRDMMCGLKHKADAAADVFVMAGDNILDFSLKSFLDYFHTKGTSCVMRFYQPDAARLTKCGVILAGSDDRILSMEEKPLQPKSHWCCPPFYIYRCKDIALLQVGIESGCGIDAPGSFAAWLSDRVPVHAMEMPGKRYDIGNMESYKRVCELFG